jgi:hypothetical protein
VVEQRLLTLATLLVMSALVLAVRQLRILLLPAGFFSLSLVFLIGFVGVQAWLTAQVAPRARASDLLALAVASTRRLPAGWVREVALPAAVLAVGLVLVFRPDQLVLGTPHANPKLLGWHLVVSGLWLARPVRQITLFLVRKAAGGGSLDDDRVKRAFGSGVLVVLVASVLGEIVWMAAAAAHRHDVYSIWAVTNTVFLAVSGARVLDGLYLSGATHVRRGAVALLVVVAILSPAGRKVGSPIQQLKAATSQAASTSRTEIGSHWFDTVEKRLAFPGDDGPVLLVAASGGGSRAALFASLVYETLRRERRPLPAQGGGEDRGVALSDRLLLASSVSGGSLASAYLLERSQRDPRSSGQTAPAEPTGRRGPFAANLKARLAALDRAAVQRGGVAVAGGGNPWPLESAFVADMCLDFMAPLLRGALNIGCERGDAVADFWAEQFGWGPASNLDPRDGRAPIVLFNATRVDRGTRVVISFPPVPPGLFPPSVREIGDFSPPLRVSTAQAVRISANFPWGFELPQIEVASETQIAAAAAPRAARSEDPAGAGDDDDDDDDDQRGGGAHGLRLLDLIDGGVLDNTGLDTLLRLLEGLRDRARDPSAPDWKPALAVLRTLAQRGLVLVEIDAGARPDMPGWIERRFPNLTRPAHAMQQASHVNASEIRERYLERIRDLFRDAPDLSGNPSSEGAVGVVRAGFECDPRGDVMTAWALSVKDRARVVRGFLAGEHRFVENLRGTFDAVAGIQALRRAGKLTAGSEALALVPRFNAYLDHMLAVDREQRTAAGHCQPSAATLSTETSLRLELAEAMRQLTPGLTARAVLGTGARALPPEPPPPAAAVAATLARAEEGGAPAKGASAALASGARASGSRRGGAGGRGVGKGSLPSLKAVAVKAGEDAGSAPAAEGGGAGGAGATAADADADAARTVSAARRRGWIYLGGLPEEQSRWVRPYFDVKAVGARLPRKGETLVTTDQSFIREAAPNEDGALGRPLGAVRPGTKLDVLEVERWRGTSLVWARVAY